MFRGSSFHTIDPKGRIIIPTRFRDVIKTGGNNSIMITGWDNCLYAYCQDIWGELEQKILHLRVKSEAMRRFQRLFIGGSNECKCDAQGRVLIPPTLKRYAGLEKEIVLVGVLDRFEIWSKDGWDHQEELMKEDLDDDRVNDDIAQLGI